MKRGKLVWAENGSVKFQEDLSGNFILLAPEEKLPSYQVSEDGESIQCLVCGLRSFNPNDVENKFCGHCHRYHVGIDPYNY